ncbi:MAG: hypothetical protein RR930_00200 [Clostridium sp.]
MRLRYVKVNPSGNTTVFILDPVPEKDYTYLTRLVMEHRHVGAEQVGFICKAKNSNLDLRMEMVGDSFCGNGSCAYAAWMSLRTGDGLELHNFSEREKEIAIEVSGPKEPLIANVRNMDSDYKCFVTITMPLPFRIRHGLDETLGDYSLVEFEGISQLVLWNRKADDKDFPAAKELLIRQGAHIGCFGIMFYQQDSSTMKSLVYVGGADTLVWEESCGSGSSSVVAAMADRKKESILDLDIHQVGGTLTLSAYVRENKLSTISLGGIVEITSTGTIFIDEKEANRG